MSPVLPARIELASQDFSSVLNIWDMGRRQQLDEFKFKNVCEAAGTSVQVSAKVRTMIITNQPAIPALSEAHRQHLHDSGITDEVINQRGYRTAETKEDLEKLHFSDFQQRVPALVIPLYDHEKQIKVCQIRPDSPRAVKKKGEEKEKAVKYDTPKGMSPPIDVHPAIRERLLDGKTPVYFTEGSKKADSAISRGLCCVALPGVWMWKEDKHLFRIWGYGNDNTVDVISTYRRRSSTVACGDRSRLVHSPSTWNTHPRYRRF